MADKTFTSKLKFEQEGLDKIASLFDQYTKDLKTSTVLTSKLQKEQEKLNDTQRVKQENLRLELSLNEKLKKVENERYQASLKNARERREKGFDFSNMAHPGQLLGKSLSSVRSKMNAVMSDRIEKDILKRDANIEKINQYKKVLEDPDKRKTKQKRIAAEEIAKLTAENKGLSSSINSSSLKQYGINTAINGVKAFGKVANKIFQTMGIDLKSIMSSVMTDIKNMLGTEGIASWDMGSSIFTNSSARETQMRYGLSSGQAYALTQTMSMLNMKNDEDLMYMNQQQKEVFNQLMNKYDAWYSEFQRSGAAEELQKAQLEFNMFKQELSYKLLNWFAANRDTIMTVLEGIMGLMQFTANVVSGILSVFGKKASTASALTSDYTSSSYGGKSINVNVQNTNNATANLNNKKELEDALTLQNADLVKQIALSMTE